MMRLNPPVYLMITLVLSIVLHLTYPITQILDGWWRWSGIVLIFMGGWITIWADGIFKGVKTTVKPNLTPSSLVTAGPFHFSRHPMYLGMMLLFSGIVVSMGTLSPLAGPVIMWAVLQFVFIPHEEKVMRREFGESYLDYCKRVRMWI